MNVASVSRQHARLRVAGSRCILSDAGSSFGTQVNGTTLKGEADLKTGDVFHCGAGAVYSHQTARPIENENPIGHCIECRLPVFLSALNQLEEFNRQFARRPGSY